MSDERTHILQGIRQKIDLGLDQAERGDLYDGEEVFRELLKKLDTGATDDPTRASPDRSR